MPQKPAFADEASIDQKADHAIITPKRNLKAFARKVKGADDVFDEAAIAKAEAALGEIAAEFDDWMGSEIARLDAAYAAALADGFFGAGAEALYAVAHDMRGQAATLGYPLAGAAADSLCRLIDAIRPAGAPAALVLGHVEAMRAIVRQNVRDTVDPTGVALIDALLKASEKHLATIAAPPIAPE